MSRRVKFTYTSLRDGDARELYRYHRGKCVSAYVLEDGLNEWSDVDIGRRYDGEVDIPDSATLLATGGL